MDIERLTYGVLGLNGEAGEVAEDLKKYLRKSTKFKDLKQSVALELGDVVYYVNHIAKTLGTDLEGILELHARKMNSRKEFGKDPIREKELHLGQ